MPHKSTPFLAFASAALPDGSAVPEWLHLLPAGEIKTEDGRVVKWDGRPLKMVSFNNQTEERRIIIDINHATALRAAAGHHVPAQGWIEELQLRDDGLWGRAQWTETGKATVMDRQYRSISPEIFFDESHNAVAIRAVSLTNRPALKGLVQIFATEDLPTPETENDRTMKTFLALLCASLHLKPESDETAVVSAVNALIAERDAQAVHFTSLAKLVGAAEGATADAVMLAAQAAVDPTRQPAVKTLQVQLLQVSGELKTLREGVARKEAEAFIDAAFAEGRIGLTADMKPHYVQRFMTSEADAAHVRKEIGVMPIMKQGRMLPTTPPEGGAVMLTAEQKHVASRLGLSEADYLAQLKANEETN